MGAAYQAGLINEKFFTGQSKDNQKPLIKIPALSKSIVFTCNQESNLIVLIEAGTPVPVRKSEHLTISNETTEMEVQISLHSSSGELTKIAQVIEIPF